MEVGGSFVAELVVFVWGEGDAGARFEDVGFVIDSDGEGALGDEEDFPHVVMRVDGSDVTGLEDRAGELGDSWGFSLAQKDLLFDGRVVGDAAPRKVWRGEFHGVGAGGGVADFSGTGRVAEGMSFCPPVGGLGGESFPESINQKMRAATAAKMRARRMAFRLGKGRLLLFLLGSGR